MTIEVRVPQLPESVADATLVSWHKKPGDAVARDENLVDLETDKVVLEVPAPVAGVLKEIKLSDGTTVTSGQLLAVIEEGATAVPGASAPAIMAAASGATTAARDATAAKAPASSTPAAGIRYGRDASGTWPRKAPRESGAPAYISTLAPVIRPTSECQLGNGSRKSRPNRNAKISPTHGMPLAETLPKICG